MSDERLTTGEAIRYLESIIYEDFAPYTQKCLLKVIEAAKQGKSVERIVERLEEKYNDIPIQYENTYEKGVGDGIDYAIEIVKGR